jgi:fructose-1-phosphate kinase PfkB-like protein
LSGSLPPGLPPEAYLELIAIAKAAGLPVSLDTSGPELPIALTGAPDLAKPNQGEAELALGGTVSLAGVADALRRLRAMGPRTVALTLGAAGAAIATPDEAWIVTAPPVDVVNPIGSGDSFLATWLHMTRRGAPPAEAARWAVAAGSANAAVPGAAACTRAQIEALLPATRAVPLAEAVGV